MSLIKINQKMMQTYLSLYKVWVENCDKVAHEDLTLSTIATAEYMINDTIETVKGVGIILEQGHQILEVSNFQEIAQISLSFFILREFLIEFKVIDEDSFKLK